ncbi:RNA polymerase sigma factor [Paenibacillus arenilitoris]|uniref:Sigma-70 family RNA polymerase sigma factor n=1 Tax=Paenibacillus arenilitoris TaxID=2772299 RepID=A0A927CJ23_9BACL|nr:sigma-70 family RNA polymerase sigma factor [Paenibacillus arenilitoris]MBD2867622.1 sigma-70 family RNA polymerase sigma factor [Paenibacillus arenilitoris]
MNPKDDKMSEALREMCEGSVEAFDRFYAHYAPFIMQIALRTLGDTMEAEDVCHDVMLEALRRGTGYDPSRGSLEAWLAVMTKSRCLDRLRRSKRVVQTGETERNFANACAAPAEEDAVALLEKEALRSALLSLPDEQRRAVIGNYFDARTQRELSDRWSVPLGTVKSWIRYGIRNMRKQLEKHGWNRQEEDGAKEVNG